MKAGEDLWPYLLVGLIALAVAMGLTAGVAATVLIVVLALALFHAGLVAATR